MSRLYAKSYDFLQLAIFLKSFHLDKYHGDGEPISWKDVRDGDKTLKLYLSPDTFELLREYPVKIMVDPLFLRKINPVPKGKEHLFSIYSSPFATAEYQRDYVYRSGKRLCFHHLDYKPEVLSLLIQDEYRDVVSFLVDYLYLKHKGVSDSFALKRLIELRNKIISTAKIIANSKDGISEADYSIKHSNLLPRRALDYSIKFRDERTKMVEDLTQECLIPFSSMDAALQLIDMDLSTCEMMELLDKLILNSNGNRAEILWDMGVTLDGSKRLLEEYKKYRKKS